MTKESEGKKYREMMSVGNYTKHAIENFEENLVNQKDYLEKVKANKSSKNIE